MLLRRRAPAAGVIAMTVGLLAAPSAASAVPDQELPFTCAQQWTGTTRATHRPSSTAVDFNRPDDLGSIVLASAAGVVSRVEDAGSVSYGKWVKIEHADGYSTLYAHLKTQWVSPGQFIDQGVPIGRVGATGGVSGAHLHYEQRLGGKVVPSFFHRSRFVYGTIVASQNCPDVPLAGDWNGDGRDEVAVFRRGPGSGSFELQAGAGATTIPLGRPSDLPVTGDWDGDGVTDVGLRRASTRTFVLRTTGGAITRPRFGLVKDRPVAGDWDGDGATDLGVWRPSANRFRLLRPDGTVQVVALGGSGVQPLTGDWDGDGSTDVGVFDTATATFRLRWTDGSGKAVFSSVRLGSSTDLAVAGDWNGDGVTDLGAWTPATGTYVLRTTAGEVRTLSFGSSR